LSAENAGSAARSAASPYLLAIVRLTDVSNFGCPKTQMHSEDMIISEPCATIFPSM
jgi:hypothetical protein